MAGAPCTENSKPVTDAAEQSSRQNSKISGEAAVWWLGNSVEVWKDSKHLNPNSLGIINTLLIEIDTPATSTV